MADFQIGAAGPGAIISSTGSTGLQHCRVPRYGCFPPALRAAIEARIEQLIELLDQVDGDPEFEWLSEETDADGDECDQSVPESTPWNGDQTWNDDPCAVTNPYLARLEDAEADDFGEREEDWRPVHGVDQREIAGSVYRG